MKVLVLSTSPRREGNSAALAKAAAAGAVEAGHDVEMLYLQDFVDGMLRDCRLCRDAAGCCSIADGYKTLLMDHVLPADAVVIATPLHYYGMTARLKAFFDRLFCYTSNSAPEGDRVLEALPGKRVALLVSCEESYQGATLGLVSQMQELTRYNRQDLVGVVVGVGNSRGEVADDPSDPLGRAADLGRRLSQIKVTDYRLDTNRSNHVWSLEEVCVSPA